MNADIWRVELASRARRDIAAILRTTLRQFGSRQQGVYSETIKAAIAALVDGPFVLGSSARNDIRPNLRTLHVAREGRRGRHFIVYRAGEDRVIEIVRILHDAMDLSSHLPNDANLD